MNEIDDEDQDVLDNDGYPTDFAIEKIKNWDVKDVRGCFEFIKSIWRNHEWGWKEEINEDGKKELHISTGGWSGNEELIRALMESKSRIWHYSWQQSRYGGHYIFIEDRYKFMNEKL